MRQVNGFFTGNTVAASCRSLLVGRVAVGRSHHLVRAFPSGVRQCARSRPADQPGVARSVDGLALGGRRQGRAAGHASRVRSAGAAGSGKGGAVCPGRVGAVGPSARRHAPAASLSAHGRAGQRAVLGDVSRVCATRCSISTAWLTRWCSIPSSLTPIRTGTSPTWRSTIRLTTRRSPSSVVDSWIPRRRCCRHRSPIYVLILATTHCAPACRVG